MRTISRRDFLQLSALATAGGVLMACAPQAPAPPAEIGVTQAPVEEALGAEAPPAEEAPASGFAESPMLAEKVAAGELPPVEDRLPREPKLVNEMPASQLELEVGQYGGALRTVTSVPDWDADIFVMCNEPLINTPGILGEEITPNIFKSYEVSDDQTEFTFYLREGLKWSDGEPVTTEDVRFAIEDVLLNEELTPTPSNWLRAGNNPANKLFTFENLDDFAFRMTFDSPYGGFLPVLAIQGWRGYTDLLKPAHFLKQYHADYADAAKLEAAAAEENLETWVQLFSLKDVTNWELCQPAAIGFPGLYPWLLTSISGQIATYERNPYYFKVDAAGQQLPYIDKIVSTQVADMEMVAMKHISGEVDFARESASLVKMPLYRENEETANIKAIMARTHVTYTDVFLNLTFEDPVWREVVQNVKFRRALAYAIDYEELIDAVYYGFAQPSTFIPSEFDLDKANALLDEIGMDQRDSEGYRLGPDGNTFVIPFETGAQSPDQIPVQELFVQFWEAAGIKCTMKRIDSTLMSQRVSANEYQASSVWTHTPLWYMGDWGQGWWGQLWNRWYGSGGRDGEEPPEDVKIFLEKVASISEVSPEEGRRVFDECKQMLYDNIYYFVHIERQMQPLIVSADLGNVSESPEAFAIASNFAGEQFFFRQ